MSSITESPYPVRNVPSILYTNPPVASTAPLPSPHNKVVPNDTSSKSPVTPYESSAISSVSSPKKIQFSIHSDNTKKPEDAKRLPKKHVKDTDDYIFQMYIGSLSVIGLFVLFRLIQKS